MHNQKLAFYLFLNQNICCAYSKWSSQWDGSFEHTKQMFKLKNIGIKHGFLMHLHLLDPLGFVKTLAFPKGEGFNNPQGVQQMLMHQKTMFDHYYCIKSFCHLKTLEKHFEKFIFVLLKWRSKAWRIHRFWKRLFQSKDLHHLTVTKLGSLLFTLLLLKTIFVTA